MSGWGFRPGSLKHGFPPASAWSGSAGMCPCAAHYLQGLAEK